MLSPAADAVLTNRVLWEFWPKQADVMEDTDSYRHIYAGAFAAGKTYLGARWTIRNTLLNPPDVNSLICEPTYGMCIRIAQREVVQALNEAGIRNHPTTSPTNMAVYFDRPERCIWFQSGDDPLKISGTTVGSVWQDEPAIQQEETHRRLNGRLRDPRAVGRWHLKTGTHEGLGWFHRLTEQRHPLANTLVWKTITVNLWDNGSLTDDFIQSQLADYQDPILYQQYILGKAMAVTGSIYGFHLHDNIHLRPADPRVGSVFTGWDFNIKHMTTVCGSSMSNRLAHFWDEVVSKSPYGTSTDVQAQRVIDRLSQRGAAFLTTRDGRKMVIDLQGNQVRAYVDASGKHRHPSAHQTDIAHLQQAGFLVIARERNPFLYDRIANAKAWLTANACYFDPAHCPRLVQSVRSHPWAKGSDPLEPKKEWDSGELEMDHFTDAWGYSLCGMQMIKGRTGTIFT